MNVMAVPQSCCRTTPVEHFAVYVTTHDQLRTV